MRNLSVLTPVVSIFCIFFLLYQITLVASSAPPPYVPDDAIITLDCGSATADKSKDMYSRDWSGDFQSKFFPKEENNLKSSTSKAPVEGTVTKAPYTTARISSSQFTYVFPVTVGPKFVRLHFNPVIYPGFERSNAFFTVKAGSITLLRNFTASVLADSSQKKPFFKEFCVNAGKDQKLNLTFIPFSTTFYAFINGIEIVPMPDDLYYSPIGTPNDKVPLYVGQNPEFYINYSTALEMVYRLNVAGNLISPTDDTGFFRQWSSDNNYFKSTGTLMPHQPSWILDYVYEPNYTAPDDVYRSARTMGFNRTKNRLSNLTWGLPVDTGFNYLVRLHFCEIDPNIYFVGLWRFIIYIDSLLAEQEADVIGWTDKIGRPVYKDYVVNIRKKGDEGSHNLSIDLHPITTFSNDEAILNGVEVFKLSNSDGNLAGPSEMLPTLLAALTNKEKESNTEKTIFIVIGGGVGFLVVLTSVCIFVLLKLRKSRSYGSYFPLSKCWCWHNPYKGNSTRTKALSLPRELCRHFSLDEIRTATYNFHQELIIGRGGFGCVYKGFIDQLAGTTIVAIKRLNPESRQGAREFKTEIKMLSQLRHGHLVSLIGYCNDEGEMILVYEYMINGTLSDHLFDTKKDALTWKQRLEICIGAAHGLHYLHTCMKNPIIHRDVKATNILLDDKWGSKVSDFGLSKMGLHETAVSSMVKGTFGYLDPDYARNQQVTAKSDVYSFGVVLLEVLCGRKALNSKLEQEQWHLANWARKCIEKGTINQVIDPHLKGKIAPDCFKVYVEVAESCVRDHGIDRPTMNDVMEKLEFAFELQQNADAEQEKINPSGDITYQEVLSFRVSGRTTDVGASQHINVSNGPMFESDSSIVLSTGIIRDVTVNSNTTT
ncbi:receptor-like protein kinase FERONIA [Quercus lobata]|uniref:Protein kinase domain-containing protein n=1 Tax=Quercus lobata TaxID=97700 RepID=A0A7N2N790_QUELO|nr:receptor-like protein kinase FERONIA [Quercus lobata]